MLQMLPTNVKRVALCVRRLDLHGSKCALREDALAAVGTMGRLRRLNLSACAGCTDAAVASLSRLTALRELNLVRPPSS